MSRAPRPADAAEPPIINTFFWPDVDPKNLRDTLRYEGTVTAARRRLAIKTAMSEVNAELYDYRDARCWPVLKRWPRYPAEAIDGVSIKLTHYFAAVSSLTAATIVERYRGYNASCARTASEIEASNRELSELALLVNLGTASALGLTR